MIPYVHFFPEKNKRKEDFSSADGMCAVVGREGNLTRVIARRVEYGVVVNNDAHALPVESFLIL